MMQAMEGDIGSTENNQIIFPKFSHLNADTYAITCVWDTITSFFVKKNPLICHLFQESRLDSTSFFLTKLLLLVCASVTKFIIYSLGFQCFRHIPYVPWQIVIFFGAINIFPQIENTLFIFLSSFLYFTHWNCSIKPC